MNVTEHDYALALETTTVAAGSVALNIRNNGPSAHELLAFRTDLPEDQLPLSRTPASLGGAAGKRAFFHGRYVGFGHPAGQLGSPAGRRCRA